jgi:hypothetical protein
LIRRDVLTVAALIIVLVVGIVAGSKIKAARLGPELQEGRACVAAAGEVEALLIKLNNDTWEIMDQVKQTSVNTSSLDASHDDTVTARRFHSGTVNGHVKSSGSVRIRQEWLDRWEHEDRKKENKDNGGGG